MGRQANVAARHGVEKILLRLYNRVVRPTSDYDDDKREHINANGTHRPWVPICVAVGSTAGYGLCWLLPGHNTGLAWAAKSVFGTLMLLWLPGLPLAYLLLRKPRVRWLDLGAASLLLGLTASIALTAAAKAFVSPLTTGIYLALVLGLSIVLLPVAASRMRRTRVVKPAWTAVAATSVGCLVVVLYPLLGAKLRLVDGGRYWPIDLYARVAGMEFGEGRCPASLAFEDERGADPGPSWEVTGKGGTLVVGNEGVARTLALRLLVEAQGEAKLELWQDGLQLRSFYVHPRFELPIHPRNYPPSNFLIDEPIVVPRDGTRIAVKLIPWPKPGHPVCATIVDAGVPTRDEFWRCFRQRYLAAPTGDTREQISLARSLIDRAFPYSYSFRGSVFGGGGYTISNLPAPYYVYSFALLAFGDSSLSLHVLYLAEVLALYLIVTALMRVSLRGARWRAQLVAVFPVLTYVTLMRFMVESLYVHTLLTLLVLIAAHFALRGQRWLFGLAVAFAILTKGGIVLVSLLLLGATLVRNRRGLRVRALWTTACVSMCVAVSLLAVAGLATGSLSSWWDLAKGSDYGGRFTCLGRALAHFDATALQRLGSASFDLTLRVLLASCVLPTFMLLRRDRAGQWLFAVGLAFHLVVCLSDTVWHRVQSDVHPLNYFTPTALLWAIAGGRALLSGGVGRRHLWIAVSALAGIFCVGVCRLYVKAYEGHFVRQGIAQREDLALAVNDYLFRRGVAVLSRAGDDESSLDLSQAYLEEATRPRVYAGPATPRLRAQRASCFYWLAQLFEQRGDPSKARAFAQKAIDEWPDLAVAKRWLDQAGGSPSPNR